VVSWILRKISKEFDRFIERSWQKKANKMHEEITRKYKK
jgi:hypothetical protein